MQISSPFPSSPAQHLLSDSVSNQPSTSFFSEMRAQPSRASCLPRTKTDRRNLCEPRRYERRLPISEYHDLTLSRFSRYVASRGPGRSGWARPAVRLSCSRLCLPKSAPEPARPCPVWGHAKPDRSPLFCRYLTVCLAGGAGANIAGNQCGDGGGGPVRISGPAIGRAPAGPAGPVLSQCPECENGLEVGAGGGEGEAGASLRVVDRFRFCSISQLDCGRLMLSLRLTGVAWGPALRGL